MYEGNLISDLVSCDGKERFDSILSHKGVRIERIVSHGHATDPGLWYDQDSDEWVLLIQGLAVLEMVQTDIDPPTGSPSRQKPIDEQLTREVTLQAGDHLMIPAHVRHRVQSTDKNVPTVWLAIHWEDTQT